MRELGPTDTRCFICGAPRLSRDPIGPKSRVPPHRFFFRHNTMQFLESKVDYEQVLKDNDTWMFDCDGVLWHGDRLIDGAVEVLSYLRSQSGWHLLFLLSGLTVHRLFIQTRELFSSRTTLQNHDGVIRKNLISWEYRLMLYVASTSPA